jgi:hypothetical protein
VQACTGDECDLAVGSALTLYVDNPMLKKAIFKKENEGSQEAWTNKSSTACSDR